MYGPTPARPSKSGVRRSKAGCIGCRQKRRKCDEVKPSCGKCEAMGVQCRYSNVVEFRDVTGWAAQKVKRRTQLQIDSNKERGRERQRSRLTFALGSEPSTPSERGPRDQRNGRAVEESDDLTEQSPLVEQPGEAIHVQPDALHRVYDPLPALTPPYTDLDLAASMPSEPSHAFTPSWSDCMTTQVLAGSDAQDLIHVSLDPSLGSHGNGMWQDMLTCDFPSITLGLSPTDDELSFAEQHVSPVSSSTALSPSALAAPVTDMIPTTPGQTIWLPRLPNRLPDMPVRERLYLAHFTSQIVSLLPGQTHHLRDLVIESEPVRSCASALAAANLANRGGTFSTDGSGHWVTVQRHHSKALSFASGSAEALHNGSGLSLGCRVVMLILMLCFYLEVGSLADVYRALAVLDSIILNNKEAILLLPSGRDLARCWLGLRALCEGTLQPHSLYGRESQTEMAVSQLESRVATTPDSFVMIAAKAQRLGRRIILCACMGDEVVGASDGLERLDQWWSILKGERSHRSQQPHPSEGPLSEEDMLSELAQLRDKLEVSEPPLGLPLNFDPAMPMPFSTEVPEPLHLSDHEQTMALVAYASAQIACNESYLLALKTPERRWTAFRDSWLHLLLRIASGLNLASCSQRNMYRQGIFHHIQCAVMLLQDLSAAQILDHLFKQGMDAGGYYEDSFTPLSLSCTSNKLFCRELTRGRKVYMVCSTYNSWTGRDILFSQGAEETFMIFGREPDGRHFSEVASLNESHVDS